MTGRLFWIWFGALLKSVKLSKLKAYEQRSLFKLNKMKTMYCSSVPVVSPSTRYWGICLYSPDHSIAYSIPGIISGWWRLSKQHPSLLLVSTALCVGGWGIVNLNIKFSFERQKNETKWEIVIVSSQSHGLDCTNFPIIIFLFDSLTCRHHCQL